MTAIAAPTMKSEIFSISALQAAAAAPMGQFTRQLGRPGRLTIGGTACGRAELEQEG